MIDCLIASGRSGAERVALDYALSVGMPCGGYTGDDFWVDDRRLDEKYQRVLIGDSGMSLNQATEMNVKASDATLLLVNYHGDLRRDELETMRSCIRNKKSLCVIDLTAEDKELRRQIGNAAEWLLYNTVEVIHISGSCESFFPGTASRAGRVLDAVLGSAFLYLQQHPELQPEPNRFAQRSWKSLNMQGGKA